MYPSIETNDFLVCQFLHKNQCDQFFFSIMPDDSKSNARLMPKPSKITNFRRKLVIFEKIIQIEIFYL